MRKMWRRGAAVMLAIAVMLSSSGGTGVARAQDAGASRMSGEAAGVVQPDYELDFETWNKDYSAKGQEQLFKCNFYKYTYG